MLSAAPTISIEEPGASTVTAALARRALGTDALPEAYFNWLGKAGYGEPAIQIGAYEGGTKIGHVAISPQAGMNDGRPVRIGHVIDLFIDPERRSVMAVQALYRKAMAELKQRGFDVVCAVPNADATQIDRFFLKVKPEAPLPITMIPATPFGTGARIIGPDPALLAGFIDPMPRCGTVWSPLTLASRLTRPGRNYVLVTDGAALCIASPRRFKGVPMTLICGMLARPGMAAETAAARHRMRKLASDAAALCGQWSAVYVGRSNLAGMPPGLALPDNLRPSPMVPHMHALTGAGRGYAPERFESIDFDFA